MTMQKSNLEKAPIEWRRVIVKALALAALAAVVSWSVVSWMTRDLRSAGAVHFNVYRQTDGQPPEWIVSLGVLREEGETMSFRHRPDGRYLLVICDDDSPTVPCGSDAPPPE